MLRRFLIVGITMLLASTTTASASATSVRVPGVVTTASTQSFEATWDALVAAIDANPNLGIVATIDHAAAAAANGLELEPTREIFFGNPALGTPLMQRNQTTGIDLPQKMLVWQSADHVYVSYNSPRYLQSRHSLGQAPQLATARAALRGLAEAATGSSVDDATAPGAAAGAGLVLVASPHSAGETFDRLVAAIEAAPPNVAFTLEHDVNAADVGLDLAPTKLVVFGNPLLGTPLMQQERTIAIDLPQKMLVFEAADGSVYVAYNDARYVAHRHDVTGLGGIVATINGALATLATAATAP